MKAYKIDIDLNVSGISVKGSLYAKELQAETKQESLFDDQDGDKKEEIIPLSTKQKYFLGVNTKMTNLEINSLTINEARDLIWKIKDAIQAGKHFDIVNKQIFFSEEEENKNDASDKIVSDEESADIFKAKKALLMRLKKGHCMNCDGLVFSKQLCQKHYMENWRKNRDNSVLEGGETI